MRLQIDLDAAGWFVVSFIASAFGLLAVLSVGLAVNHGPLGNFAYLLTQGLMSIAIYGTTAALLVRARPWRTLVSLIVTLFLLSVIAAVGLALLRFIAAPGAWSQLVEDIAPAATFGLLQVDSLAPFKLGPPDPSPYLGVVLGFLLARWQLRRAGKTVGDAARPRIQPWPLNGGSRK